MRNFKSTNPVSALWIGAALSLALAPFALAQEELDEETMTSASGEDAEEQSYDEELVVVGSRSERARTTLESPVPVDVLNSQELNAIGNNADITDSLRSLVPSYNASMASGDGDTFVRPTSLRGLAPDQTLVLVNGKRRHRSATLAEFVPAAGRGAHGPNIGLIPAASIEAIEVLRDGAGAQYGSDAIAGVINLRLRDDRSGGMLRTQRGIAYAGEPTYKVDGWVGMPLGESGHMTISGEWLENHAHSRGDQRPEAEYLPCCGVARNLRRYGTDTPFHDAPLLQTWGRPEAAGTRLAFNTAFDFMGVAEAYSHGTWSAVDGRYRFFYRSPPVPEIGQPGHETIWQLAQSCWDGRFWLTIFYPSWEINTIEDCIWATSSEMGYTPYFDGYTRNFSANVGMRGGDASGLRWDFSVTQGEDKIDYELFNTRNGSLGVDTIWAAVPIQVDFYIGRLRQMETLINLDFDYALSDSTFVAFGGQIHEETFVQTEGEPLSYFGTGASGFRGFTPDDSGEWMRDSFSLYTEVESELNEKMFAQVAVRYEDFSDFGSTVDWKFAGRVQVTDELAVRGSVSTGFHAPTPGQSNFRKVTTTFDNDTGLQVESGTVPPDHPLAIAAGGAPLTAETSNNFSFGVTGTVIGEWQLTADLYQINIADRIYKTQQLPTIDPDTGIGSTIEFYTNALDISSSGFDIVLAGTTDLISGRPVDLNVAFNYNRVGVEGQNLVNGIAPVRDSVIEDIEHSYPNTKIVATGNTMLSPKFDLMVRVNYYGPHYDERGRIGGVDGNAPTKEMSSTVFVDFEVNTDYRDKWHLAFGLVNAFDVYPDRIEEPFANRLNVGLPYARRTAANFEGGSWYLSAARKW